MSVTVEYFGKELIEGKPRLKLTKYENGKCEVADRKIRWMGVSQNRLYGDTYEESLDLIEEYLFDIDQVEIHQLQSIQLGYSWLMPGGWYESHEFTAKHSHETRYLKDSKPQERSWFQRCLDFLRNLN